MGQREKEGVELYGDTLVEQFKHWKEAAKQKQMADRRIMEMEMIENKKFTPEKKLDLRYNLIKSMRQEKK